MVGTDLQTKNGQLPKSGLKDKLQLLQKEYQNLSTKEKKGIKGKKLHNEVQLLIARMHKGSSSSPFAVPKIIRIPLKNYPKKSQVSMRPIMPDLLPTGLREPKPALLSQQSNLKVQPSSSSTQSNALPKESNLNLKQPSFRSMLPNSRPTKSKLIPSTPPKNKTFTPNKNIGKGKIPLPQAEMSGTLTPRLKKLQAAMGRGIVRTTLASPRNCLLGRGRGRGRGHLSTTPRSRVNSSRPLKRANLPQPKLQTHPSPPPPTVPSISTKKYSHQSKILTDKKPPPPPLPPTPPPPDRSTSVIAKSHTPTPPPPVPTIPLTLGKTPSLPQSTYSRPLLSHVQTNVQIRPQSAMVPTISPQTNAQIRPQLAMVPTISPLKSTFQQKMHLSSQPRSTQASQALQALQLQRTLQFQRSPQLQRSAQFRPPFTLISQPLPQQPILQFRPVPLQSLPLQQGSVVSPQQQQWMNYYYPNQASQPKLPEKDVEMIKSTKKKKKRKKSTKKTKKGVINLLSDDDDDIQVGRKTETKQTQGSETKSSNYTYKTTQVKITTFSKSSQSRSKKSTQVSQEVLPEVSSKSSASDVGPKPPPTPPPGESCQTETNAALPDTEQDDDSEHHDFCIGWLLLTLSESDDKGLTGDEPYTTTLEDVHRSLLQDYSALFPHKKPTLSLETLEEAWNSGGLEEQSQKKIFVLCQPKKTTKRKSQGSKKKARKLRAVKSKKSQSKAKKKKVSKKKKKSL